jgi:lipooligosaccharide transport system permease protein
LAPVSTRPFSDGVATPPTPEPAATTIAPSDVAAPAVDPVSSARAEAERIRAQALLDAEAIRNQARSEAAELRRVAALSARDQLVRETRKPVRRFDFGAVIAVMSREITVFLRSWRSTTFSAVVEPTIFLIGFGYGFGAVVSRVSGVRYIEFVGTGIVAVTVVFSSAFPAMFSTFVKRRFQRVYDALLSAPVDVDELVTAEVLWLSIRAAVYSMAPIGVAVALGLRPGWGVVFVPLIAFLTGLGFAAFGVTVAAELGAIDKFNYVISGVLTPLLLAAGTYFPLHSLPHWGFIAVQIDPLYHCVELVRHAVFGLQDTRDEIHVGVLLGFAVAMWRIAIWRLRLRLID